jgi:cell division protein FtsI/penicillin-binding protein 2
MRLSRTSAVPANTNEPAQTRMLGKTGTAELKKSLDDEARKTAGSWP